MGVTVGVLDIPAVDTDFGAVVDFGRAVLFLFLPLPSVLEGVPELIDEYAVNEPERLVNSEGVPASEYAPSLPSSSPL